MKRYKNIILIILFALLLQNIPGFSQQPEGGKKLPTKEEVLNMSYDDLLNMPFEDLIKLANIVGVSAEDLLQMILNKEVSSASKSKETVFQSPLSTTVVTKEEIQNAGITSIPEALRLVPGMIVREKTPGNYDVHIRGNDNVPSNNIPVYSENSMSLVMIDGRPVYNSAFGGTFWETLPIGLIDIERIEVIRGPSSALYGPNAVTGVINIITKKTSESKIHVNADAQVGNIDTKIANASVSGGIGKLRARISGNYTEMGRFTENFYHYRTGKYLSRDSIAKLKYNDPQLDKAYLALGIDQPQEENIINKIPHPSRADYQYGVNAFLFYDLNDKVNFNLSLGTQNSDNITNVLGNHELPFLTRTSNTSYFDFKTSFYGFQAQLNYMTGDQDYERLNAGFHNDVDILNAALEYEYKLGTLILRPGISYQQSIYDDSKYVDVSIKGGYLNGAKNLNSMAYYLRADYRLFDKLRLIAAIRSDKYNKPNKNYFTYQFITSYEINKKNIVRAIYSRANRGPFMADTYSDYYWKVISNKQANLDFLTLKYLGNQNLKLPQMDMFELGYRSVVTDKIQIDIEAFHTVISNYSYFTADSIYAYHDPQMQVKYVGTVKYQNFDLKSIQSGITATLNITLNNKLNFSIFGTFQKSELKNLFARTTTDVLEKIRIEATTKLMSGTSNTAKSQIDSLVDKTNKATPSFYGGGQINYIPIKKLTINSSFYFYGKQTYTMNQYQTDIDPKFIVNLKVSYKVWKENSIYLNARNLFDNDQNEFGFMDKIGGMYLIGVNLNF
jgi:iron complex outermembrane recepter protein